MALERLKSWQKSFTTLVISLKYENIVTVKKFPFMTESKFKTMDGGDSVGGEMVHFGGEVISHPVYCLDQNVYM